jgi:hypothetical protein
MEVVYAPILSNGLTLSSFHRQLGLSVQPDNNRIPEWDFLSVKGIDPQENATTHRQYASMTDTSDIHVPFWLLIIATIVLGSFPWLPHRFSLRTLLIATTLVAVVLGLIVWLR